MKLYWRYKKDGKWTWKPVGEGHTIPKDAEMLYAEEEE